MHCHHKMYPHCSLQPSSLKDFYFTKWYLQLQKVDFMRYQYKIFIVKTAVNMWQTEQNVWHLTGNIFKCIL